MRRFRSLGHSGVRPGDPDRRSTDWPPHSVSDHRSSYAFSISVHNDHRLLSPIPSSPLRFRACLIKFDVRFRSSRPTRGWLRGLRDYVGLPICAGCLAYWLRSAPRLGLSTSTDNFRPQRSEARVSSPIVLSPDLFGPCGRHRAGFPSGESYVTNFIVVYTSHGDSGFHGMDFHRVYRSGSIRAERSNGSTERVRAERDYRPDGLQGWYTKFTYFPSPC